jgi:hypothetical protein
MIAIYQKLADEGCGGLVPVIDKKYYPPVWQGFCLNLRLSGTYPVDFGCPNWGVWFACESGLFDEEFGAQYGAGEIVILYEILGHFVNFIYRNKMIGLY